jgi:hypothetical protein
VRQVSGVACHVGVLDVRNACATGQRVAETTRGTRPSAENQERVAEGWRAWVDWESRGIGHVRVCAAPGCSSCVRSARVGISRPTAPTEKRHQRGHAGCAHVARGGGSNRSLLGTLLATCSARASSFNVWGGTSKPGGRPRGTHDSVWRAPWVPADDTSGGGARHTGGWPCGL